MRYILSAYGEQYVAEDLQLPTKSILSHQPAGHPYSFVSPVRLPIGKACHLAGHDDSYELMVNGCFGFAYTGKYFISGIIVARQTARHGEPAGLTPELMDAKPA